MIERSNQIESKKKDTPLKSAAILYVTDGFPLRTDLLLSYSTVYCAGSHNFSCCKMLPWEVVRLCLFVMFLLSFYSISVSSYKSVLLRWHQKYNRCSSSGDNVNIISTKDSFNLYMNQQNEKHYPPYIFEPIELLTSNIYDIPAKRLSNTIVLKNKYIGLRHGQSLANVEGRFHHH